MLPLLLPIALTLASSASASAISASCSSPAQTPSCSSPPYLTLVQSWDPEAAGEGGSWLVRSLDVESCDGSKLRSCGGGKESGVYSAEEIMSFVERAASGGSGGKVWGEGELERSEGEWAGRTEGEGIEEIWERAWATSGTCLSTMNPACEAGRGRGEEVAPFFQLAHRLHSSLNPSKILDEADMIPSDDTTYSLSDLLSTLSSATGYHPILHCREGDSLETISWPAELHAGSDRWRPEFGPRSVQGGGAKQEEGNCPEEGIKIHPSLLSIIRRRKPEPSHTWDPIFRPSPRPINPSALAQAAADAAAAAAKEKVESLGVVAGKLGFFYGAHGTREKVKEERDGVVGRKTSRDEL